MVMMAFQNCGTKDSFNDAEYSPEQNPLVSPSGTGILLPGELPSENSIQLDTIEFVGCDQSRECFEYSLDIETGIIDHLSTGESREISSEKLDEILNQLKKSAYRDEPLEPNNGIVCPLIYIAPHARLMSNGKGYPLIRRSLECGGASLYDSTTEEAIDIMPALTEALIEAGFDSESIEIPINPI